MDVISAVKNRRTIRQFQQKEIPQEILKKLIDSARLAPSARNYQPLEYIVVNQPKVRDGVFELLSWGGKLKGDRPSKEKRPTAYVIVISNNKISPNPDFDVGLAVENILLTALYYGLGSCVLGAVDREKLRQLLGVPFNFEIKLVIALGYPAERPVAEDVEELKEYWRDERGILHVPKRKLTTIIHFNKF